MSRIIKRLFFTFLIATASFAASAASEGDTQTEARTVCSPSTNTCTTTYTTMVYINGQWYVTSTTTVVRQWRNVEK